jgi:hypothetical protein
MPPARRARLLPIALALAAGLPIAVMAIHTADVGWVPTGDRADYAVKALDVFSSRSPLTGPWSSGATIATGGDTVYSPGPLLYWLMALPLRLPWGSAVQVAMGLVNLLSLAGVMVLARRRGGDLLMLATAVALPLMLRALPPMVYADIWNSSAPLVPFVLLVFLAWSLACGEAEWLPLTVLVASFIVQTHLTFLAATLGALAVGLVGLLVARPRPPLRRSLAWSAGVGLVCWVAPLIDQIVHRPGNLVLIVRSATSSTETLGRLSGLKGVVHTVGVPPWWLKAEPNAFQRLIDLNAKPSLVAAGSTAIVVLGLGAAVVVGLRRRAPELWSAGAIGLVICLAIAVDVSSTPREAALTTQYTLRWAAPAGMCVWLLLGWCATAVLPIRLVVPRAAVLAGVAAVAAVALAVTVTRDYPDERYRATHDLTDEVKQAVPSSGATRLQASELAGATTRSAIAYALRRAGRAFVVEGAGASMGSHYAHGPWARTLLVGAHARGPIVAHAVVGDPARPVRVALSRR